MIIFTANIITINPNQPYSQSLAIHGDQILTVGSNDRVRSSSISGMQHVDVEGHTIVPGFIEAHCYDGYSGLLQLGCDNCDLRTIPSIQVEQSLVSCL